MLRSMAKEEAHVLGVFCYGLLHLGGGRLPEKDPGPLKALVCLPSAPSVFPSSGKSHIHVVLGEGGRLRGQAAAEPSQVTPCETVTVAVKCSRRRIS